MFVVVAVDSGYKSRGLVWDLNTLDDIMVKYNCMFIANFPQIW